MREVVGADMGVKAAGRHPHRRRTREDDRGRRDPARRERVVKIVRGEKVEGAY